MDGVCLRWTEMDEDRQRWPKFLTARCVMLANITASGRPAEGFLTRLRLDESADARRKGEGCACTEGEGEPRQEPAPQGRCLRARARGYRNARRGHRPV